MKILQVADVHFGAEDDQALRRTSALAADVYPDAIIVCGDLTQRGKRSEFAAARAWLGNFGAPRLVVPGNHDTPLLNLVERVTSPFERFEYFFGDNTGDLVVAGWRFAGINTARGWQTRRNWAEGVVNIDDLSTAASGDPPTAIVCHHPFISPPRAPLRTDTKRGDAADETLKHSGASLLLCGHVHAPTAEIRRGDAGGYLAVTAGTLSTRLRSSPPSCNLLEIEGDRIEVVAMELAESEPVKRSLGEFRVPLSASA